MQTHHTGGALRTPTPGAYQPWPCLSKAVAELHARMAADDIANAELISTLDAHIADMAQAEGVS